MLKTPFIIGTFKKIEILSNQGWLHIVRNVYI